MQKQYDRLISDLKALGIEHGDILLMHSSLSSLGMVDGGAIAVINAIEQILGCDGTLLLPALSYATVNCENPHFDYYATLACVGAIPEAFRRMDGVVRSLHPTHSVCAWGKYSLSMTCDHQKDNTPVGANSPFRKLCEYDAKILMLGCGLRPLTFMHGVEEVGEAPYLLTSEAWRYELCDKDSNVFTKDIYRHNFGDLIQRYDRISNVLPKLREGSVLEANAYLMNAKEVMKYGVQAIKSDPYYFVE